MAVGFDVFSFRRFRLTHFVISPIVSSLALCSALNGFDFALNVSLLCVKSKNIHFLSFEVNFFILGKNMSSLEIILVSYIVSDVSD